MHERGPRFRRVADESEVALFRPLQDRLHAQPGREGDLEFAQNGVEEPWMQISRW